MKLKLILMLKMRMRDNISSYCLRMIRNKYSKECIHMHIHIYIHLLMIILMMMMMTMNKLKTDTMMIINYE